MIMARPSSAPRGRCSATSSPSGSGATCSRSRIAASTGSASARAALRARYAAFDHPAAREILAWLDGHWNVTDELVQTQ